MIIVTTEGISGRNLEHLGLVKGSVVQTKNIVRDFAAGLKTIIGGEIKGYTEMMIEARTIATRRMIEEAEAIQADAVVTVRFSTSAIMEGSAEIICYGTAVKFR